MFQSRRVCRVTHDVEGEQLESVGGAVGELLGQAGKQVVQFLLSKGIAPCAQNAHGFVAGPECPARSSVTVVNGQFRIVQLGPYPVQEIVTIAHATSMIPASQPGKVLGEAESHDLHSHGTAEWATALINAIVFAVIILCAALVAVTHLVDKAKERRRSNNYTRGPTSAEQEKRRDQRQAQTGGRMDHRFKGWTTGWVHPTVKRGTIYRKLDLVWFAGRLYALAARCMTA